MAKIVKKEKLADKVWRYRLDAPRIAKKRMAGQFIILRPVQGSERIPLTIANVDAAEGWIEIIFQTVGRTTMLLEALPEGGDVLDLVGPLGKPTHIEKFGRCVCIGGGVGVAPLYPIVSALHAAGNHVTSILGARSRELLILENEFKTVSDSQYIATDDGSYGTKGFVSTVFQSLVGAGERYDAAFVIGPVMMMKVTSALTCGGCRVTVGGETKFACVDGPEFDAVQIDWDEMVKRLSSYKPFEQQSREDHECQLKKA
jgi:ferredoxin--NADP+ reductase